MDTAHRNVLLLAVCQALLLTNGVALIAINGLAGALLASDRRLATLPVMTYVVGAALATLPASFFMRRHGRRAGFMLGSGLGMLGGAVGAAAMAAQSFGLLCLGTVFSGMYNAFGQYYRFAAADTATPEFKSRAISLTLGGGIVGGVIGPEISRWSQDLMEPRFMATYCLLVVCALGSLVIARGLDVPPLSRVEVQWSGRPLAVIVRQPNFLVAVLAAAVGYGVMNLLMSATPLAMEVHAHPFGDTAFVLQWHVVGMFAPSFVTGWLIRRFGVLNVLLAGSALMFACIGISVSGASLAHFWFALLLLGVGWNFLYIGGTTLLTDVHTTSERAKTQGLNDFLVFLSMTGSSFTSGLVLSRSGWSALNQLATPFLAVVVLAAGVLWVRRHPR